MESIVETQGVIKMSILKDKFAFSKRKRFDPTVSLNHNISYEPMMSDFERVIRTSPKQNSKAGMGGSSPRFDYYSNRRK